MSSPRLDKTLFDQIVDMFLPDMGDPGDRKALIENALYGSPVLSRINWRGAAYPFTVQLVRTLDEYGHVESGKAAVVALLENLRKQVGADRKQAIDDLLKRLATLAVPTVEPPKTTVEGELYVFISYARPDQAVAEQVEAYLKAAGVRVFRDTSDIGKGADWDMTIEQALNDAHRMVLLLSPASMPHRKEVHREWFFFDQVRKPIYPLYLAKCKLHSRMYAYNYFDVTMLGLQQALEQLLGELSKEFKPPEGEPDRITVEDDSDEVEARTLPEVLKAVHQAVLNPKGSVALSKEQIKQLVEEHKPRDLSEYHLARIAEWSQPRYQLDNRFVNLTLLLDQGEEAQGGRWAASENRRFTDLREAVAARPDDPALVLLGAPGSGKSTLLRRFQLDHAADMLRTTGSAISFFVPLNAFRADSGQPRDWLNAEWSRRYPDLPSLNALLAEGQVILLLDALNEMSHKTTADYHQRVGLWREFIQEIVPDGNRVLFSCRSLDYSASLSSKELRVPQIVAQPMTDKQIWDFIAAYLPARAETVWKELGGQSQLDLFRTPYFLKLLCEQVEAHESVPKGRAGLFTGFVRQALEREITDSNTLFLPDGLLTEHDHQKLTLKKWRDAYDLPELGVLIPSLGKLAYAMQQKGLETEGAQIRINYDDARVLLGHDHDATILRAGMALNVLDEDVSEYEILFFHQLLQEYFAARKLAEQPNPDLVRVEWQADRVAPSLASTLAPLADSDPLPLLPQTGWEETVALASVMVSKPDIFVRALMETNLPSAARCAANPEAHLSPALISDIQAALIARTQDKSADLRARIAAGLALGELGDPRFERKTGPHGDYLLPPLTPAIPAGEYPLGDDGSRSTDDKPAHTVTLDAFQIGVFPVTNAEYALFMAAGAYNDDQWWEGETAKAWLRGESGTEGSKQGERKRRKLFQSWTEDFIREMVTQNRITATEADEWIKFRNWSDERFEQQLEEWYPSGIVYRQPDYWYNTTFNALSQPVVGICWYEARAYCAWLSAQTGLAFRLPSEAEVEAATRGTEGRQFAYGQDFDVTRGNTYESHLRRPTPVGIFDNATPEGAFDLSGNAHTWTSSIFDQERFPYPYNVADGRENTDDAEALRVFRGGSWYFGQKNARAPYRNYDYPTGRFNNIGFRVVCRPSSA